MDHIVSAGRKPREGKAGARLTLFLQSGTPAQGTGTTEYRLDLPPSASPG